MQNSSTLKSSKATLLLPILLFSCFFSCKSVDSSKGENSPAFNTKGADSGKVFIREKYDKYRSHPLTTSARSQQLIAYDQTTK